MQKENQNRHQGHRDEAAHIIGQSGDVSHSGQTRPAGQTGFVLDLGGHIGTGSISVAAVVSNSGVGILTGLQSVATVVPNLQAVAGIQGTRAQPKALAGKVSYAAAGSNHNFGRVRDCKIASIVAVTAVGTDRHGGIGLPETARKSCTAILRFAGDGHLVWSSLKAVAGYSLFAGCL